MRKQSFREAWLDFMEEVYKALKIDVLVRKIEKLIIKSCMSNYQNKIKKQYEDKGYFVTSVVRLGDTGFPDLLCLKDGKAVWIECKEKNDTLKPLQKYRIRQLRELGFEAFATQDTIGVIY